MPSPANDKKRIVTEIPAACVDEAKAVEFLEKQRWCDDPKCPRCESEDVYQMRDRQTGERNKDYRWRCRGCGKQYTVRTGTVFEDSRISLTHWCHAFWRVCSSKKGVSALQIKRETGLTYKSALFLMHRIRWAMANTPESRKHLHRYVSEFEFRYNTRKTDDGGRLQALVKGAEGKRLRFYPAP